MHAPGRIAAPSRAPMRLALAALILAAVAGCAGTPRPAPTRMDDPALAAKLRAKLAEVRPRAFMAVHRVVLSIRGREFAFSGYARESANGALLLRADGDMGGTLFDIDVPADGRARVVDNPGPMRDSWLLAGAARDIEVMYRLEPSGNAALVRFADGEVGFVDAAPDGVWREYGFDPESRSFVRFTATKNRQAIYEARFSDSRLFAGWATPQPGRVTITNSELGYTLDVHVVEMHAAKGE